MKRLITIATPEIRQWCNGFVQNHKEYALACGYEYVEVSEIYWKDLHPSYSKVHEISKALKEGCEYVLWADADVIFMDYRVDLVHLIDGSHWSDLGDLFLAAYQQTNWPAWPYLCAGLTVWRNCKESQMFVQEWVDRCEHGSPLIVPGKLTRMLHEPWEQWYMDELNRKWEYKGIRACTAKEIGCFAPEIWHDGTLWEEGMPTIHLAGPSTWERREEIAHHYLRKVVC